MPSAIELHPWQDAWSDVFSDLARDLRRHADLALRLEHVGSTAVRPMASKPIVDVLAGVDDATALDGWIDRLKAAGFVQGDVIGPQAETYFFCRAGPPNINLHLTLVGSRAWCDLLTFRDRLRAQPATARRYENLKRRLAESAQGDMDLYTAGKSTFVADVLGACA